MSRTLRFWHTCVIMHGDFIVIAEPWGFDQDWPMMGFDKDCGDKIDAIFMQLAMQNNYPRQVVVKMAVFHKSKISKERLSFRNSSKY